MNDFVSEHPITIAEIGANHDGDLSKAHRMIDALADAGASHVKFQLYTVEELVADPGQMVTWGPEGRKRTESMGEMFGRLALSKEGMGDLFTHARDRNMVAFASPFSEAGVDTLMELGAPLIKIAASDVGHLPLLEYAAGTGRPIILSLGKCTLAEADEAVSCLEDSGCTQLALLHCVASYPSPMEEMNIRVIPMLKAAYPEHVIGFSDHSIGITASLGAVVLGAKIVEKHVTLDRRSDGPDHWFSLEVDEFAALARGVREVHAALGSSRKRIVDAELIGRQRATRSIVAATDLTPGTIVTEDHIRFLRPGGGIPPRDASIVIGMMVRHPIKAGSHVSWDDFKTGAKGEDMDLPVPEHGLKSRWRGCLQEPRDDR